MNDDYLWDPRGGAPADPEIARLENALGELRYEAQAPEPVEPVEPRRWNLRGLGLAAGMLATIALVAIFTQNPPTPDASDGVARPAAVGPSWLVTTLAGAPRVGTATVEESAALAVGDWLVTDEVSRARLELPGIGEASGEVEVGGGSRLQLKVSQEMEHRLQLAEGRIDALIYAPPRIFFVDTATATAVDYGCAYSLEVDAEGAGALEVTLGWVALEEGDRSSFVPHGARCEIRPGVGPGTPHFDSAQAALREALARFDFAEGGLAAVEIVCREAESRDTLTLWHLLQRVAPEGRPRVLDRMLEFEELCAGATREGLLALDPQMLEQWKDELRYEW